MSIPLKSVACYMITGTTSDGDVVSISYDPTTETAIFDDSEDALDVATNGVLKEHFPKLLDIINVPENDPFWYKQTGDPNHRVSKDTLFVQYCEIQIRPAVHLSVLFSSK